MAVSEIKLQVKVRHARLLELGLYSSLLSAFTVLVWWVWQRQTVDMAVLDGIASGEALSEVAVSLPILTRLLLQKPIILTFALAQFVLGLALLMAIVPARWWLGARPATRTGAALEEWPDHLLDELATEGELDSAFAAGGAQTPAAQANGQPGATPGSTPGAAQPGAAKSQTSQQSGTPAALGQSSALQDLAEPVEEELLESLSDVSDILASFMDDEPTDPRLVGLSASLDEIEITALADASRQLAHHLQHAQPRRPLADRPNKPVLQRQRV